MDQYLEQEMVSKINCKTGMGMFKTGLWCSQNSLNLLTLVELYLKLMHFVIYKFYLNVEKHIYQDLYWSEVLMRGKAL